MEVLNKENWEESKKNLIANLQQATMAKMMIERQIALCDEELAKFPVETNSATN